MCENGETESPSEEKMDISDASSGSTSQLPGLELSTDLVHTLDNRPVPAARTTKPTPAPRDTDKDTDNADRLVSLSSALASLKLPTALADPHLADEPVDFPSCPKQMKLLTQKTLQAQGLPLTEEEACEAPMDEEEEDASIYQAVLSPDCSDVRLLKAERRGNRKKRIAVSADILNGPGDDSDSDTELPESNKGVSASRGHGSEEEDLDVSDILSLDSPDEIEESIMERLSQQPVAPLPELTAAEERAEERNWRSCKVAGLERQIDMKVIAPYKRVLHHGGYLGGGAQNAIIVFTACYLPDRSRRDYDYVMDNLFLYVLTTLDQLVAEDYVLVYLHGATVRSCMPTFSWLKRCYHMIDRRLRKNLKGLYLVHPTFWLKTIVVMTRPFVSTKFSRKLSFVETLTDLAQLVPLEQITIPERVKQYDMIKQSIQQLNNQG